MSLPLGDLIPDWSSGEAISPESLTLLRQFERRGRIYQRLLEHSRSRPRALVGCGPLLRALLALEVEYRSQDEEDPADNGNGFENIYACALLLFDLGAPEDALRLWEAKRLNMDLGVGIDVQFLVGAGVDETLDALSTDDSTAARAAAAYLQKCRAAGDFEELTTWRRARYEYFLR